MTEHPDLSAVLNTYPRNCTFAELFYWHLYVHGTRPEGRRSRWTREDFLKKFASLPVTTKTFDNWLGKGPAPNEINCGFIIKTLLGEETEREDFRRDLLDARDRSDEGGNSWQKPGNGKALVAPENRNGALVIASRPAFTQQIVDELGLRRELLESLAFHFEHENPNATDQELSEYLKAEASEYRKLKSRHAELTESDTRINAQMNLYVDATLERRYDKACEIAHAAEKFQRETALKQVWNLADLRAERGKSAYRNGDINECYQHIIAAVSFLSPFGWSEQARLRLWLVRHELPSGSWLEGNGRQILVRLLEDNLRTCPMNSWEWVNSHAVLGETLWGRPPRKPCSPEQKLGDLKRAIASYEIAAQSPLHICDSEGLGNLHHLFAFALEDYADVKFESNNFVEARQYYDRAIASREIVVRIWTPEHHSAASRFLEKVSLASLYRDRLKCALSEEKETLLMKAERFCRSVMQPPNDSPFFNEFLAEVLEQLSEFKRGSERQSLLRESLDMLDICSQRWHKNADLEVLERVARDRSRIAAKLEASPSRR